ncbi:hypothetical protein T03_13978 [Trichinella britovi]|uniref:Uncharacterized protein n=1 Tax=Trichinella britovi TaxID=45882 RepID=A0A0V0YUG9_TRIBR|nr:hypothetical protein T03_13978 [Trichinella britovi]
MRLSFLFTHTASTCAAPSATEQDKNKLRQV